MKSIRKRGLAKVSTGEEELQSQGIVVHIPERMLEPLKHLQGEEQARFLIDLAQVLQQTALQQSQEGLQPQVIAWLQTPDWETSQIYLQTHPRLLTDAAGCILELLKYAQREKQAQDLINIHQVLVVKARVEGTEATYEHFLASQSDPLLARVYTSPLTLFHIDKHGRPVRDPAILGEIGIAALRQYRADWTGNRSELWCGVLVRGPQTDSTQLSLSAWHTKQSRRWAELPLRPHWRTD